jgi:hypothetical protein
MRIAMMLAGAGMAMTASFAATAASAAVIEDFETGGFGAAWVHSGGIPVNGSGARDGAFGVSSGNSQWTYRTDVSVDNGEVLSAWARPGQYGRVYLGFGADASGASSFVLAQNTGQLLFQNNDGYAFNDVSSTAFTWGSDWYLATITLSGGTVTGRVYGSDGVTLLGSLVASGLDHGVGGGVAVRSFNNFSYDTIGLTAGVPEPATWALMIGGFGLAGAALRRRRAIAA